MNNRFIERIKGKEGKTAQELTFCELGLIVLAIIMILGVRA
jgi:hypothetical protein